MAMHLAQMNIADPRYPLTDPRMDGFMTKLDEINAIADATPGFVWRLVSDDSNNATDLRTAVDGADKMINVSVWESRDALWNYVYRTDHLNFLRQRNDWFVPPAADILVLWWIPVGHIPTPEEGAVRLELLRRNGPSADAFTFRQFFDAPAE
jgi:heme-degrading monooxygenase HmoA